MLPLVLSAAVATVVPFPRRQPNAGLPDEDARDSLLQPLCPPNDRDLVEQALAGRTSALSTLYERHAPRIHGRIARLLGRASDAEDVLHETFIEAFRDLSKLREPDRFGAWLERIAVHRTHRRFRYRRLLERLGFESTARDLSLEALALRGDPELGLELRRVDEALSRLPAELHIAWKLRAIEGLELSEVAERCGCSLATAKRRIERAQRVVRNTVGVAFPEPLS